MRQKKKVLTKIELTLEYKALEKKYEELIIEKDNLLNKIAVMEKVGKDIVTTAEQESQTKPNSQYVEISCTECIFLASCEDELNYHMGEEHDRDFISYFESDFPCSVCDRWCKSEKDLNHHMKIYHGKRVKFCDRKIENNGNESEPKDSMDISMEELESKNTYTCNICKEKFESKSGMMKHRKKEHIEQVKTCWNFESNRCPFAESLCWFRHTNSELPQEKYDCKFCGEVFKTKNELQIHKKMKHSETVPFCTNDKCWYGQEKCWFRHKHNENEKIA